MKGKKIKGGFTLMELLATLLILSIVVTIVIVVATNVINNAKDKSYEATANNIENVVNDYVVENSELVDWMDTTTCRVGTSCQYQCVTVNELLSSGYFKEAVLDSLIKDDGEVRNVKKSDIVYIERNEDKAITHKEFGAPECGNEIGNIIIDVEPSEWSQSKNVTITYVLNNTQNANTAKYYYDNVAAMSFNGNKKVVIGPITITTNRTINAKILTPEGIVEERVVIDTIDNVKPEIEAFDILEFAKFTDTTQIRIKLRDYDSGIKGYYFGMTNPNSGVTYTGLAQMGGDGYDTTLTVTKAGTWYLQAIDMAGNKSEIRSYTFVETNFVGDSNMTTVPTRILLNVGDTKSYNLSNKMIVALNNNYVFSGWYNNEARTGQPVTAIKAGEYVTLYGKVVDKNLASMSVRIDGTARYQETLSSTILGFNGTNSSGVSYQWYVNGSNSTTGGTLINNSGSTYNIGSGLVGKYIYLKATVNGVSVVSNVIGPIKKASGYINLNSNSSSMVYTKKKSLTVLIRDYHGGNLDVTTNIPDDNVVAKISEETGTNKKYLFVKDLSKVYAGNYTITVTSAATDNYEAAKAEYKLTIDKLDNPTIVTAKNNLVYNGTALELVSVSNSNNLATYFSTTTPLNSTNYSTAGSRSIPKATNIGTYTVYYYVVGNASYKNSPNNQSVQASINDKKTGTINITYVGSNVSEVYGPAQISYINVEHYVPNWIGWPTLHKTFSVPVSDPVSFRISNYHGTITIGNIYCRGLDYSSVQSYDSMVSWADLLDISSSLESAVSGRTLYDTVYAVRNNSLWGVYSKNCSSGIKYEVNDDYITISGVNKELLFYSIEFDIVVSETEQYKGTSRSIIIDNIGFPLTSKIQSNKKEADSVTPYYLPTNYISTWKDVLNNEYYGCNSEIINQPMSSDGTKGAARILCIK